MTSPHQKFARPESIHAASLHPSIQSIVQYLIPYRVLCDIVVKRTDVVLVLTEFIPGGEIIKIKQLQLRVMSRMAEVSTRC